MEENEAVAASTPAVGTVDVPLDVPLPTAPHQHRWVNRPGHRMLYCYDCKHFLSNSREDLRRLQKRGRALKITKVAR